MELLLLLAASDADRILEAYERALPADERLAFYRLDWEPDIDAALERAESERRPVFFMQVENLSYFSDAGFYTGFC